jgi:glycerol dehydrogenase
VAAFLAGVGLPLTLSDLGVPEAEVPRRDAVALVAARATTPGETIHNMPFAVDAAAVCEAIRAADAVGTVIARDRPAARARD